MYFYSGCTISSSAIMKKYYYKKHYIIVKGVRFMRFEWKPKIK